MRDAGQFAELKVAEMLHADPDADAEHGENQAERTSGRPQQEQAEHGENGGDAVEKNHDLAMRHAMLQQLVVDVLAIGGEDRTAADQAANDGERQFPESASQKRQPESRRQRWWALFALPASASALSTKSDKQTAGVAKENGRGIEVVAEKSENRARQSDRHHGDQGRCRREGRPRMPPASRTTPIRRLNHRGHRSG